MFIQTLIRRFATQPAALPLDEAMVRWFKHIENQKKGREVIAQCRRDFTRRFGPRPLDRVTPQEIVAAIEHVRDTYGPGSAEHALSYVGRFYRWAQARGLTTANPAQGLTVSAIVGPRPSRERVLSETELAALWAATSPLDAHDRIIRLLALTGMRRGEVGSLESSEINYRDRQLEIPGRKVKNGRPLIVPLSAPAMALLPPSRPQRRFIFGRTGRAPFIGWSRCKERLDARSGVKDWVVHDLRRTFVTFCNEHSLAAPWVIEAAVGHISGPTKASVAGVYNRATWLPERRALMDAWAEELRKIAAGTAERWARQ